MSKSIRFRVRQALVRSVTAQNEEREWPIRPILLDRPSYRDEGPPVIEQNDPPGGSARKLGGI